MRLFYIENTEWTDNSGDEADGQEMLGIQLGRRIKPNKLYLSTDFEVQFILLALRKYADASFLKILTIQQIKKILAKDNFPVALGNPEFEENVCSFETLLKNSSLKDPIRIGVISPYGRNLGDTAMFFSVIKQYKKIAADLEREIEIHLVNPVLTYDVRPIYENFGYFDSIKEFPCRIDWFSGIDAYVDFVRPHLRYDVPWIDSLLELSGIPPETVPDQNKRISFDFGNDADGKLEAEWERLRSKINKPIIIFHRQSTTQIRTMPGKDYFRILREFFEISDYHFVSLTPVKFDHPRFTDLSHLSTNFRAYVKLISLADGFITVDTSLYHFADAFDIPGVVIFTSQPPDRFSKFYPFVKGFQIEGGEKLDLKSWSNDPADIEYSDGLWSKLNSEMLIDYLKEVSGKKLCGETTTTAAGYISSKTG